MKPVMQTLQSLNEIAATEDKQRLRTIVDRLEQEHPEYAFLVRQHINDSVEQVLNELTMRYPMLSAFKFHPHARQIVERIQTTLREKYADRENGAVSIPS